MTKDKPVGFDALRELFPKPDILSAKRILCVQPHPDDADIACGGAIARLSAQGTEVFYLTVTDDTAGFSEAGLSLRRRRRIRREEQTEAGRILGVRGFFWLDFRDAGPWDIRKARNRIIAVIREVRPDFLLTVDPWLRHEAHRDHVKAGLAACEAAILCDLPYIAGGGRSRLGGPVGLSGVGLFLTAEPDTLVDYSGYEELKRRAISAHASQFSEDERALLFRYDELRGGLLGKSRGLKRAEGLHILHPRELHAFPSWEDNSRYGVMYGRSGD
jgi:LmbE family N-acetylglucosaminyl deacetylase